LKTIALELVPPVTTKPGFSPEQEACRIRGLLREAGLDRRVNTILVPQLVAEDDGRPVALHDRMDPLDLRLTFGKHLPYSYILSQVTVYTPALELETRVRALLKSGVERVVFVGAPRNAHTDYPGPMPDQALGMFRTTVPSRGVILIPTRVGERERVLRKLEAGASFLVTQLLFSEHVVAFLRDLAKHHHRPQVLLSFGYVPRAEQERGLLRWLIRDDKSPHVPEEMERITKLAALPVEGRKAALVDLYRRVVEEAARMDFPLGVHFECPYGVTAPALETFQAMLEAWSPA
jgi:hypothetical protein